jgi:hypothetical protein
MNTFRDPAMNDRLDLPQPNMGHLHRRGRYPTTGGRPAGSVQAYSPFIGKLRELGFDLSQLMFEQRG